MLDVTECLSQYGPMLPTWPSMSCSLFQHSIAPKLPPESCEPASTSNYEISVARGRRHHTDFIRYVIVSSETPIDTREQWTGGSWGTCVGRGTGITVRWHANLGKRIPPHLESDNRPAGSLPELFRSPRRWINHGTVREDWSVKINGHSRRLGCRTMARKEIPRSVCCRQSRSQG
jgi:hypothetical protein